jgi:hypothetical protein
VNQGKVSCSTRAHAAVLLDCSATALRIIEGID